MTSSLDALVTDSSPGAWAWATGNKSVNNWHGVFPDNNSPVTGLAATLDRNREAAAPFLDNPRVENIAEFLQRTRRMSTGVVSTVAVTDSTPGAFSSHSIRYAQTAIAEQMLSAGHSVILGGGGRYFLPQGIPFWPTFLRRGPMGGTSSKNSRRPASLLSRRQRNWSMRAARRNCSASFRVRKWRAGTIECGRRKASRQQRKPSASFQISRRSS